MIHEHLAEKRPPVVARAEPDRLKPIKKINQHPNKSPQRGSGEEQPEVSERWFSGLKKNNAENFGEQGGSDHIGPKRDRKPGFLLHMGNLFEKMPGSLVSDVEQKKYRHQALEE